ncbi:unnamed protein product [Phytophthora fragariaefolia]|uniref:Unnamed protein product n=1 Tax=Phytophthora fragariaefolia TaxID=1490495 RepID=A0A9W6XRK6_9STRA|nr:unnamed protein product [Phytophthora fragariaefolia]
MSAASPATMSATKPVATVSTSMSTTAPPAFIVPATEPATTLSAAVFTAAAPAEPVRAMPEAADPTISIRPASTAYATSACSPANIPLP